MGILFDLVHFASLALTVLIIARVVLSWVDVPANALVVWIYRVTEPMLGPIRSLLPSAGGLDFSPLVVILLIQLIEWMLIRILISIS